MNVKYVHGEPCGCNYCISEEDDVIKSYLDSVDVPDPGWSELFRCSKCGTYWYTDQHIFVQIGRTRIHEIFPALIL